MRELMLSELEVKKAERLLVESVVAGLEGVRASD